MELGEILRLSCTVSDETVRELEALCESLKIAKGEAIVWQGKKSNYLFFVKTGLFRVAFEYSGKEDTICFGMDGDPFMSLHSYYAGEVSAFSCIALVDSEVYRISFDELESFLSGHIDMLRWMKNLLVEQVYAFEKRYVYFGTGDAYSRYVSFAQNRTGIIKQVPTKYIAQYLKIRPETLYRIRAKFIKNKENRN